MSNTRNNMLEWNRAERAIYDATQAVEAMPASPLLTDAVILLSQAKEKVSQFVQSQSISSNSNRDDDRSNPIMQYFAFKHLPEKLQAVSRPIDELAEKMDAELPNGPEKSAGLRKLLEAKDCLVRAAICCLLLTIIGCKSVEPAKAFAITAYESRPEMSPESSSGSVGIDVEQPKDGAGRDLKYDVTVYTAAWCGPCESAKRRDGDGDSEIRLTWVEQAPPKGIREVYPTYVWTDAKGCLRYVQGAHQLPQLLNIIERKRNDPPQRRGAN